MSNFKKYKKSSELLGKKIVLYTAFSGAVILTTAITLTNVYEEPVQEPIVIDNVDENIVINSVDDNQPVTLSENNNNTIEENTIYQRTTNIDEARKIIEGIKYIEYDDTDDEDIIEEIKDGKISEYFIALQIINEANPYQGLNMEEYANNHYELFNSDKRESDEILVYNALAYQRLIDNDVDIVEAVDELEKLMILQTVPTEMDEDEWNNTFKVLLSTIDDEKHESLTNIYLPLAYDLHMLTCDKEHTKDNGTTFCDNLENEYSKLF